VTERPTFFVDRSLGKGVGRRLREAGATVELHDDHFAQTTPDSTWIPEVTSRGWVILTKDKNIRRSKGEREDVLTAGARVFTLTSGNMNGAGMAKAFIDHLERMESVSANQTPPFVYAVGPNIFMQILPMSTSIPADVPPATNT
jgi:predicted nuclease of predicted toxin-antitoxin system